MANEILKLNELDSVAVALRDLPKGTLVDGVELLEDIGAGHKIALKDFEVGEDIIKYGNPIGHATEAIKRGYEVHTHNCKTNLSSTLEYSYEPQVNLSSYQTKQHTIHAYKRTNGVGIRNDLWVVVLVGCVNGVAKEIADTFSKTHPCTENFDGIYPIIHPYGCSQLGDDHQNTVEVLRKIVNHPNAGGVLVLGLGCENNQMNPFKEGLVYDENRVRFLVSQECEDEVEEGLRLCEELYANLCKDHREELPLSSLTIGLKCGGSDGFSGISANPLLGVVSDKLVGIGGSTILTEVPEMFGAEHLLMRRAKNEEIFNKTVSMVNEFKQYFIDHHVDIYENPSPGNKAGGITTLEDKSLGCIMKSGTSVIQDVLDYGESVKEKGVSLLYGPGNDLVATTALGVSGCQLVLFTTGRGTPFGSFIPTLKVSTNSALAKKKANWIDFNAGKVLEDTSMDDLSEELIELICEVASGKRVSNERYGEREIAIFKQGVTL